MSLFTYTAVNEEGALVKGVTEAATRDQAIENITYNGLYIVSIRAAASSLGSLGKRLLYRKIKRKDVIEFVGNVALMLRAGVPLLTALADIAESIEERRFREILNNIRRSVEMGISFSTALGEYRLVFPDILIRLAAVGEETGSLDRSLKDVAEHLQRVEDLISAVQRALIYPVFALVTTFGALVFWLVFVLPQIMDTFASMGLALPLATRILMRVSAFTQEYWYALLCVPLILWPVVMFLRKTRRSKYFLDLAAIRLPVMRQITHNKLLALFAEQLRILVVAGITIDRSLQITADIIGNSVFRAALLDAREHITAGNKISDALRKHAVFPNVVRRMIEVGESSGTLDTQLGYLAEYFLKRVDETAERLSKMIEPLIILVIGLIFLFIIVSLLFPVYDLVTQIGA